MIIRASNFSESYPLLKNIWPDNEHISYFDNSFGLVKWKPSEFYNAKPLFYVIEDKGTILATAHSFRASESLVAIRGLFFDKLVKIDMVKNLVDIAIDGVRIASTQQVYFIHKENLNSFVTDLGFEKTNGPYWTNEWKVYISWKLNLIQP